MIVKPRRKIIHLNSIMLRIRCGMTLRHIGRTGALHGHIVRDDGLHELQYVENTSQNDTYELQHVKNTS